MARVAELNETNFGVDEEPMAYKGTMTRERARALARRPRVIHLWRDLSPGSHSARGGHRGHRDSVRQPQQVRAGQGDRTHEARPRAVFGGALSRRLRVHSAHAARGRRSARRARAASRSRRFRAARSTCGRSACCGCSIAASRTTRSSRCRCNDPYLRGVLRHRRHSRGTV